MASEQDSVAREAAVEWETEVAALIGPGMAAFEAERGKILSPDERLVFMAGYNCCQKKIIAELQGIEFQGLLKRLE